MERHSYEEQCLIEYANTLNEAVAFIKAGHKLGVDLDAAFDTVIDTVADDVSGDEDWFFEELGSLFKLHFPKESAERQARLARPVGAAA